MSGKRRPMDVNLAAAHIGGGKHWTKAEVESRTQDEIKMPKPKTLTPPAWLSKDGKALFRKYAKLILEFPAGLVSNLDIGTLARYCDCEISYAQASNHKNVWMETANRRLQALAEIADQKAVAVAENFEFLKQQEKDAADQYAEAKAQLDFWSSQMVKFEKIARSCATEMGMTVSSRCKLVVPQADKQEDADPLEALTAKLRLVKSG